MKKILLVMMSFLLLFSASIGLSYQPLTPTQECATNDINFTAAVKFSKKIKKLVAANDFHHLAEQMTYPLRINTGINSKYYYIKNKNEFIRRYTEIFTPSVKKHILQSNANDVFCNFQGLALFNGGMWCRSQQDHKNTLLIFVINMNAPG